jgi:CheY-like chemotaxis protein
MPSVLVVEDEDDIREAVHLLLTDEGYTVVTAPGGMRALEMLRQCAGSGVVLFDFLMPEGDGLYLLKAIAADKTLQGRFALVCMAARRATLLPPDFQALMTRFDVEFVDKPFDVESLLSAVDSAAARLAGGKAGPARTSDDPGKA